ncbi:unnamed protein product, partial [marine sediment metagenome]
QLGGASDAVRAIIESEAGVKCRTNRPGTAQRNAMHFASATDVAEAYMAGRAAVRAAMDGTGGMMVTLQRREENGRYSCSTGLVELQKVANGEKPLPREFLDESGTGITEAFRRYALPLIAGEAQIEIGDDGLPVYARLARHMVPKKA